MLAAPTSPSSTRKYKVLDSSPADCVGPASLPSYAQAAASVTRDVKAAEAASTVSKVSSRSTTISSPGFGCPVVANHRASVAAAPVMAGSTHFAAAEPGCASTSLPLAACRRLGQLGRSEEGKGFLRRSGKTWGRGERVRPTGRRTRQVPGASWGTR